MSPHPASKNYDLNMMSDKIIYLLVMTLKNGDIEYLSFTNSFYASDTKRRIEYMGNCKRVDIKAIKLRVDNTIYS